MKWSSSRKDHQQYLDHVIEQNSRLSMPAICKVAPKANLMDLYVPLNALITDIDAITENEFDESFIYWEGFERRVQAVERETEEKTISLDSLVSTESRLVVLGGAGSGKTTFISHLALSTAHEYQSKPSTTPLPLRISIRDFDQYLTDSSCTGPSQSSSQWLLDFLVAYLNYWNLGDYWKTLHHNLEQEDCLVLLDGLDEVADYDRRVLIREAIEKFITKYPRNQYIVTSRPEGYRGRTRLGASFRVCEICAFSVREIELFILKWYRHIVKRTGISKVKSSDTLFVSIRSNPYYLALAVNPFLLSAITAVYNELGRLPPYRAELYERTINILLTDWQLEGDAKQVQKDIFKKQFMAKLALRLHEEKRQTITQDEVLELLIEWVKELQFTESAERLMDSLDYCGIFRVDDIGQFSFAHRAFQEFLVASSLAEQDYYVPLVIKHFHDSWWREVILLLADLLATRSNEEAMRLVRAFFEHWREQEQSELKGSQTLHSGLFLAGECLALYGDRVFPDDPVYQDIAQELWRTIISTPVHPLRLEGARLLASFHITGLRDKVLNTLEAEEWPIRAASAYAWGFIYHGVKARQLDTGLKKLLHLSWSDSHSYVKSCAFNSLLLMAKKPGSIGDETITFLCAALKDAPSERERTVINLLGSLANTSQSEKIINALDTSLTKYSKRDQAAVIWAIGQFDQDFVPTSMIQTLWDIALHKNTHWQPCSEAISVLARLGRDSLTAKRQARLLDMALASRDRPVRSASAQALGQLAARRLFPAVEKRIRKELDNPSAEIRINCAKVLGRLGRLSLEIATATEKLLHFATNRQEDNGVRYEAIKALGRIGLESDSLESNYFEIFHDLSEELEEHYYVRCAATVALSQISQGKLPVRFVAHLIEHILAMSKDESELRIAAIRAIDKIKVPSLLQALLERKDLFDILMIHTQADMEPSPEVRANTISVLSKVLEQIRPSQTVSRFLESARTDPSPLVRKRVVQCLGTLRFDQMEQQVVDDLSGLLKDHSLDYELQSAVYSMLKTSFEPMFTHKSQFVPLDTSKERRTQVRFYLEKIMGLTPERPSDAIRDFFKLPGMSSETERWKIIDRFLETLRRNYQLRAKSEADSSFDRLWVNESSYGVTTTKLHITFEKIILGIVGQAYQQKAKSRMGGLEVPSWEPDSMEKRLISGLACEAVERAVSDHFYVRPIPSQETEMLRRCLDDLCGKVDAMESRLPVIRDDLEQLRLFQQDCSAALKLVRYIRKQVGKPLWLTKRMVTSPGLHECVRIAHSEIRKGEIDFALIDELLATVMYEV